MQHSSLRHKYSAGFTLIELLLVIAIMAVLVTFGLSTYRERTLNLKAEKVAQQMQLIMQAGSNYYIKNSCWPNTLEAGKLSNQCFANPASENFVTTYFPNGSAMRHPLDNSASILYLYNPFASFKNATYKDEQHAYNFYREGPTSNPEAIFSVVSGNLPSEAFAKRVAALLPNATAFINYPLPSNGGYVVKAQIFPPGASQAQSFILNRVWKMTDKETYTFSCPPGYQRVFLPSYQAYEIQGPNVSALGSGEGQIPFAIALNSECTDLGNNSFRCGVTAKLKGRGANFGAAAFWSQSWNENIFDRNGKDVMITYIAGCCLGKGCGYP